METSAQARVAAEFDIIFAKMRDGELVEAVRASTTILQETEAIRLIDDAVPHTETPQVTTFVSA